MEDSQNPYRILIDTHTYTLTVFKDNKFYKSYPVAVGKPSTPTPKGVFKIINEEDNPGGAYGARWLGLSAPHIGIHGTDQPYLIGKSVSHGCIRMNNLQIIELTSYIPIGTEVTIR